MLFSIGFVFCVGAASALPSRIIPRQEPIDIGGLKIEAANRIIPVVVGGPQDTFVPNTVKAAVGDIIQFQFSNGNHTVTQSAADAPCQPLQATVATAIHSGHIPFEDGQTTVGTFNMPITNADTIFLYCATGPHCQNGQVMVVNPVDDQQIVNYAKGSQGTTSSGDGTTVSGGTVASIPLEAAAFVPAPAQEGPPAGAPPAEAPAAEAPAVSSPAAEAPAATAAPAGTTITMTASAGATITLPLVGELSVPGTTTVTTTVPAPTASAAPAA